MINTYIEGIEAIVKKPKTGLEAIENIIFFHLRFSEERSEAFLIIMRDFPFDLMRSGSPTREMIDDRSARILNLISECIEQGRKDGSIRDLPPEKTAFILRGMLHGLSRLQMLWSPSIPDLTSEVIDFCRHGLGK